MERNLKFVLAIAAFLAVAAKTTEKVPIVSKDMHSSYDLSAQFMSASQLSYGHRLIVNGEVKRTHKEAAKTVGRSDIHKIHRAPKDLKHVVVISCKNRNIEALEAKLLDVSDPHSQNYGKYLSQAEISEMSNNPVAFEEIQKYLKYQGINVLRTSRNNEYITAEAPISKWEEVFGNEFFFYKQTELRDAHIVRAEHYSLPDMLLEHVEAVFNVVQFPGL